MPVPAEIVQLVELFQRNYAQYRDPAFSETAVRHQFIDPFFAALGWDVNNTQGFAEQYKEVIHEDKVRVGGAAKAPDYAFRIGKERKFFVEAKKPAVNIQHDIEPAYQLRRYAWSAKLPLSILTDFEEFSVYDCRSKPAAADKASAGRILLVNYREYVTRWDEIAAVFSKAAVWQGALDKYAEAKAGKRGTAEVDDEFLAEIERWRELLARNLVLRNPTLRGRDVNWAVQQTIDRIVFLRICEARDLETFEQLRSLLNGGHTYERLQELFRRADLRYNSGLFHFEQDSQGDRAEAPDTLTPSLDVDDKALKDIIEHLYYPQSPYEFSVLPADILGHVYERFLGKVIRLTPGRQVKIEEKPEVRKAGGVFYTPTYIVDYIVRQTVGPLLEGKTPRALMRRGDPGWSPGLWSSVMGDHAGSPLRIADIACGSGSFLLGAYQFLLDWYLTEYLKDPDRWLKGKRPPLERASGGITRLSIEERKRILMAHIYGVDIDPQAVEVTKLSLLLKVLEGEGVAAQMSFLPERVLPDLGRNIKCGNSLIGPEFYDGKLDLPDEETVGRVNAFDWAREFPEVMAAGGFDAVIGNPPYGATFSGDETSYLLHKFSFQNYQLDSYLIFVEKALSLTTLGGRLGYIIPNTWLLNLTLTKVRQFIFTHTHIEEIAHYMRPVFTGVTVDTEVVVLRRGAALPDHRIHISVFHKNGETESYEIPQMSWRNGNGAPVNISLRSELSGIAEKLAAHPILDSVAVITQGTKPFQVGKGKPPQTRAVVDAKPFVSETSRDSTYRPLLRGSLIHRYRTLWNHNYYISFGDWLAEPRYSAHFDAPAKIVIRQTGDSLIATLDSRQFIVRDNLYTVVGQTASPDLRYILGLINSRLLNWYYQRALNPEVGEALAQVKRGHLAQLPIRTINFADPADVARHDRMVALVTQMLDLHKRLAAEGIPHEKAALQRRIEMTDRQIDQLVYELYGLTAEEIAVVEGGATDKNG